MIYDLTNEDIARYKHNRSLMRTFHPALFAQLPDALHRVECDGDEISDLERIPLGDNAGRTSRTPKYAIVYGVSLGVIDYYRKNVESFQALHVVEPDRSAFIVQMALHPWTAMLQDKRVRWHVGTDAENVTTPLLSDVPEIASWGIHAWRAAPLNTLQTNGYNAFVDLLQNALDGARSIAQIQIERGLIMQCNVIQNLPSIIHSTNLDSVKNGFSKTPAVVIGAGPSLNKNIDALREAGPGVLSIATDTALRPLLKHGIKPHIVVSCDPLKINHRHFDGIASLGDACLAYLPETNAEILRQYAGHPRLICLHDLQSKLLKRLAEPLGIRTLFRRRMNVGFCGFILAEEMGCDPIILAGMDLAVSPGGQSHAEGTANASTVEVSEEGKRVRLQGNLEMETAPLVPVEAYEGGRTFTFSYFHQILRSLEKSILHTPGRVIDATEGGAKKQGAVRMTLREALQDCATAKPVEFKKQNMQIRPNHESMQEIGRTIHGILQGVKESRKRLKMGLARIERWTRETAQSDDSIDAVRRQANIFLTRWSEMLNGEALDVGADIGLARWRYATWRTEEPEGLSAQETAEWWGRTLHDWFEGLSADLELFESLYVHVLERMQTGLTSDGERQ